MIEFFLAYLITWPAIVIFAILGIICESNESHSAAIFFGMIVAGVSYIYFGLTVSTLSLYIIAYFVAGFIWSFWRYKRYCEMFVNEYNKSTSSYRKEYLEKIRPNKMLGEITTWVIVWPFSIIENLTGDIINFIQTAITKFFKGVYTRIYESAISGINQEVK